MKRILFGRQATKKAKLVESDEVYKPGSLVLGTFYRTTKGLIEFFLPNNQKGVCLKSELRKELKEKEYSTEVNLRIMQPPGEKAKIELLVLGRRDKKYECSIFTYKKICAQSFITGIVMQKEEMGYTVETGDTSQKFLLVTRREYVPGTIDTFQITSITPSTVILGEKLEREIYVGERKEITPGIVFRAAPNGIPPYVQGQHRTSYTKLPRRFTSTAVGACSPIIETAVDLEIDENVFVIVVYVSEDRSEVHAVPLDEYERAIGYPLPDASCVGEVYKASVVSIRSDSSIVKISDLERTAVLWAIHYTDTSTPDSAPAFQQGDEIRVKLFNIKGYELYVSAKEALLASVQPKVPEVGAVAHATVLGINDEMLWCEVLSGATVILPRPHGDDVYIGKIYQVRIQEFIEECKEKGVLRFRAALASDTDSQSAAQPSLKPKTSPDGSCNKENAEGVTPRHGIFMSDSRKREIALGTARQFSNGDIVQGVVKYMYRHGAFVEIGPYLRARIKISEISSRYIEDWQSVLHLGQKVSLVLYDIDYEEPSVEGSIKRYEVLSMAGAVKEIEPETAPVAAEPEVYAAEEPEAESEEPEEEDDSEFEMELFNSKGGPEPWTRRMAEMPMPRACLLWKRAMQEATVLETKKALCLSILLLASQLPDSDALPSSQLDEIIREGYARSGSTFLKHAINSTRNHPSTSVYEVLIRKYISEHRNCGFGYRELLHLARRTGSSRVLDAFSDLLEKASMASADRKEIEMAHVEVLYAVSKDRARTLMERALADSRNKDALELTQKYVRLEIGSVQTAADVAYIRNILSRSVSSPGLPVSHAKGLFKAYLKFEKEYGTEERAAKVLEMAKEYVAAAS